MSLQERLDKIRSSPVPKNEESAKVQILVPILQSLGWDPSEMLLEHAVGETRRRGRVDIALKTHGRIVALIEAKTPGTVLDNHVDQVLGYAYHESADICALTTGLEWWLYLPAARVPVSKRRFAVLRIMEDPSEQLVTDLTTFLSRETLASGQAEQRAKARLEEVRLNLEVPSIWRQMRQDPDGELVELLRKRVQEKAHLELTPEQAIAALQGSHIPPAAVSTEPPTAPPPPPEQQPPKRRKPRFSPKPTAIELWGKRYPVSTYKDGFTKFIDLLYELHRDDFDRVLKLKGHKHLYVARDPRDVKYGADGHYYEPMSSGYFFDTWLSANDMKRRVEILLKLFDHSASDFKVLHD